MEILLGSPVTKLDRVRTMEAGAFEDFVRQWAWSHLKTKYVSVKHFGGAGDKGRDIVAYHENGTFDLYQCKHYQSSIAPTQIYTEFGKLCHYTFTKAYAMPVKYFIISPHGPGPDLSDLIENPQNINKLLISTWDIYCLKKISKTPVVLAGDFLEYVKAFDFSIVKAVDILTVIEEHSTTIYHAGSFGGGIRKYRDIIPSPSATIETRELNYIAQLFEVYSEELGYPITDMASLKSLSQKLYDHFNDQRKSFYCAESLEIFSRENFSHISSSPFDEMKDDAYHIISNILMLFSNEKSLQRLLLSIQHIHNANFSSNVLSACQEIKALDKAGVCHHLANENRVKWKQ